MILECLIKRKSVTKPFSFSFFHPLFLPVFIYMNREPKNVGSKTHSQEPKFLGLIYLFFLILLAKKKEYEI